MCLQDRVFALHFISLQAKAISRHFKASEGEHIAPLVVAVLYCRSLLTFADEIHVELILSLHHAAAICIS